MPGRGRRTFRSRRNCPLVDANVHTTLIDVAARRATALFGAAPHDRARFSVARVPHAIEREHESEIGIEQKRQQAEGCDSSAFHKAECALHGSIPCLSKHVHTV
jgi:hypothetical protein